MAGAIDLSALKQPAAAAGGGAAGPSGGVEVTEAILEPDSVITIGRSRIVFRVLAQAATPAPHADPATERHDVGGFWGPAE